MNFGSTLTAFISGLAAAFILFIAYLFISPKPKEASVRREFPRDLTHFGRNTREKIKL